MLLLIQYQIINHFEHLNYSFNFEMYLNFAYSFFLIGILGMIFNYKKILSTMLTVESQIHALVILLLAVSEAFR